MQVQITSSELASIWTTYMNDSMSVPFLAYFLHKNQDEEIKPIINSALFTSKNHLSKLKEIFISEKYPVPDGYSEEDTNLNAERLYSDVFSLIYINTMAKLALKSYSLLLANSARSDIRDFFTDAIKKSAEIYNDSTLLMLNKGIYFRPPNIPSYNETSKIKSKDYLNDFFGAKRPLNAVELTEIYFNVQINAVHNTLLIGFSQIAEKKQVMKHMLKGKEIATKHIKAFNSILNEGDLLPASSWDIEITRSTDKTFSDSVMMFHINLISSLRAGHYGLSASTSMRNDIIVQYKKLISETQKYAKEGLELSIKYKWFEELPQLPNRDKLAKK